MSTALVPKNKDLAAIEDARPSYLAELTPEEQRQGTEDLARLIRPSFVKIIQQMTTSEVKKQFGEGSIILSPDLIGLASLEEKISFATIVQYTEYCKWAPLALKGQEPMIVERSFDPRSQVAIKSQSPSTWSEPHPKDPQNPKMRYRYQEHTNYIIKLIRDDLMDFAPCLISFAKSNYKVGTHLTRLVLRRHAPIWSQQFKLGSKFETNTQGNEYYKFTVEDDSDQHFVTEEVAEITKGCFSEFQRIISEKRLQANYEPDDGGDGNGEPTGARVGATDTGEYAGNGE